MVKPSNAYKVNQFLFHPFEKSNRSKSTQLLSKCVHVFLTVITAGLWQIPFWIVNRLDNRKITKDPNDATTQKSSVTAKLPLKTPSTVPPQPDASDSLFNMPSPSWSSQFKSHWEEAVKQNPELAKVKSVKDFEKEMGMTREEFLTKVTQEKRQVEVDAHAHQIVNQLNKEKATFTDTWNGMQTRHAEEEKQRQARMNQFAKEWGVALKQNEEAQDNLKQAEADFEKEMGMSPEEFVAKADQGEIPQNDKESLDEIKKNALETCKPMFEYYSNTIENFKKKLDGLNLQPTDSDLMIKIHLKQAQGFIDCAEDAFKEMKSMEEKIQQAEHKATFVMYVERFEKSKKQTEDNIVMVQSLLKELSAKKQ